MCNVNVLPKNYWVNFSWQTYCTNSSIAEGKRVTQRWNWKCPWPVYLWYLVRKKSMNLDALRSSIAWLVWSEGPYVEGKRDVGPVKLGRKFGCSVSSSQFLEYLGGKGKRWNWIATMVDVFIELSLSTLWLSNALWQHFFPWRLVSQWGNLWSVFSILQTKQIILVLCAIRWGCFNVWYVAWFG